MKGSVPTAGVESRSVIIVISQMISTARRRTPPWNATTNDPQSKIPWNGLELSSSLNNDGYALLKLSSVHRVRSHNGSVITGKDIGFKTDLFIN